MSETKPVETYLPVHLSKQQANLFNVLKKQEFCDVTFIIGEEKKEFRANRMLLASVSPVFKAMLYGSMQESAPHARIEISDIDPDGFRSVLQFAYINDPNLTVDNIISVRSICDRYQISLLSEMCDNSFSKFINAHNICSFLNQAVEIKLDPYIKECQKQLELMYLIGQRTSIIIESQGFYEMNMKAIIIFLQSDYLYVKEEYLWDSVLKWVNHQIPNDNAADTHGNPPPLKKQKLNDAKSKKTSGNNHNYDDICSDDRLKLLKSVTPYIRFGLMDGKYFVKNVKPIGCLSTDEIANILGYIICSDETCGKFITKPRVYTKPTTTMLNVLQYTDSSDSSYSPEASYSSCSSEASYSSES